MFLSIQPLSTCALFTQPSSTYTLFRQPLFTYTLFIQPLSTYVLFIQPLTTYTFFHGHFFLSAKQLFSTFSSFCPSAIKLVSTDSLSKCLVACMHKTTVHWNCCPPKKIQRNFCPNSFSSTTETFVQWSFCSNTSHLWLKEIYRWLFSSCFHVTKPFVHRRFFSSSFHPWSKLSTEGFAQTVFMHLETCQTPLCPELFKRLKQQTNSFDWPCHHQSWSPISEAAYHWCQGRLWLSVPSSSHLHNTVTHPMCHTPSSSHLHNTVTHPICTKFITPAQYSHTAYLYQVHHTCTIQSHTLSVPSSSHLHSTVVYSVVPFIKCNMAPILCHSFIYTDIVHPPPPPTPHPAPLYMHICPQQWR